MELWRGLHLSTRVAVMGMASALVVAAGSFSLGASDATAAACTTGTESDFNGDGLPDLAIADPQATVEGQSKAGLVRVLLGGGKGVAEISQSLSAMDANPEADDQFGSALAVYDADQDGCSDLVVGTPYEDVTSASGPQADAGAVYVIHGTPSGIGEGSAVDSYTQAGLDGATVTEAGDLFGFSLAAGKTSSNKPYLVVGVPGEAIGSLSDAGGVHYVQGTTEVTINEDDPEIPGVAEHDDRFGHTLTATGRYVAVGAPGEAIGTELSAGAVTLFDHTFSGGRPTALAALDENHAALVSGTAEGGDRFGTALSMIPYRPSGSSSETDDCWRSARPTRTWAMSLTLELSRSCGSSLPAPSSRST